MAIRIHPNVDGYDVEVVIHEKPIEKELERLENDNKEKVNKVGKKFISEKIERFVTVEAEPTDEKWDELADSDEESEKQEEEKKDDPLSIANRLNPYYE